MDDELSVQKLLTYPLRKEGYDVVPALDGREALDRLREDNFDLVVLDVMLPKQDGFDVCRQIRSRSTVPIIMLTAKTEETDKVHGLELGADDYITKPFSVRELLARIRAVLRRAQVQSALPAELRFGNVTVDFRRYEALKNGQPVELTRKEFGLLRFLAARSGEAVTRDDLLNEVWGYDATPTTRTVDNHVASLRAKLEDNPSDPRHLFTVHGVGYKWVQ